MVNVSWKWKDVGSLITSLQAKFAMFTNVPLLFAGLGHPDEDVARNCAKKAMLQVETSIDKGVWESQEPLTKLLANSRQLISG